MLILPPGHAQALGEPPTVRPREKVMIGAVLAVVAALAVVLIISLASAERQSRHGCISVGLAYSTGGEKLYRCGATARFICAGANTSNGIRGAGARGLSTECRKAGLPVG
ncbi:MAG: hypothetical protein ACR2GZ_00360 [Solirubrobacteraceae bacterium]